MQKNDASQFKTEKPGASVIIETTAEGKTRQKLLNEFEMCKSNCAI